MGEGELRASIEPGGVIRVWRGDEEVARWVEPREWTCVAIDGDRLAAGDRAGHLAVWAIHRR